MLLNDVRSMVSLKPSGSTIYAKDISALFHISIKSAYVCLEALVDEKLLTSVLEVWCPFCCNFTGKQYDSFLEVPVEVVCPVCGKVISDVLAENNIVVYRRL